jgi:hypothetical protein
MSRRLLTLGAAGALVAAIQLAPLATEAVPQTTEAPTGILCLDKGGANYVVKAKPGKCAVFGHGEAFGGGVNLIRLHWHGWGSARATARGIECGFHLPCERIKVKVVASGPVVGCTGQVVYSMIRAKSRFGHAAPDPHSCPGPVPVPTV